METRANHVIIGVFVVGVLAAILGFIYWMRNDATGASGKDYYVLFNGSVQGLSQASPVLFNGIRFGAVRSIEVVSENTAQVRAVISVRADTPVRVDSRARIAQQGLAGFIALEITPGSQNAAMLASTPGQPLPTIPGDTSAGGMLSGVNDAAGRASTLIESVNALVAKNEAALTKTIGNIEAFTGMLDQRKDDIATIVVNARELSARFNDMSRKLDGAIDRIAGVDGNDKASVVAQMQLAAKSFGQLAEKLDKSVGDKAGEITQQTQRTLREIELFVKDGRRLAESLDRVVQKVERNPAGFLLGGQTSPRY